MAHFTAASIAVQSVRSGARLLVKDAETGEWTEARIVGLDRLGWTVQTAGGLQTLYRTDPVRMER
jgi:hypothetical protein